MNQSKVLRPLAMNWKISLTQSKSYNTFICVILAYQSITLSNWISSYFCSIEIRVQFYHTLIFTYWYIGYEFYELLSTNQTKTEKIKDNNIQANNVAATSLHLKAIAIYIMYNINSIKIEKYHGQLVSIERETHRKKWTPNRKYFSLIKTKATVAKWKRE